MLLGVTTDGAEGHLQSPSLDHCVNDRDPHILCCGREAAITA